MADFRLLLRAFVKVSSSDSVFLAVSPIFSIESDAVSNDWANSSLAVTTSPVVLDIALYQTSCPVAASV